MHTPNNRRRSLLLSLLLLCSLFSGYGGSAAARPAAALPGWSSVVARLDSGLSPARAHQFRALGAYVYRNLPIIHSAAVRVPNRNLRRFAALPFVTHVSPDTVVRKCDEFTVNTTGANTAYTQQGLTGAGVAVAVLDSGVRASQPDLQGGGPGACRVVASVNFVSGESSPDDLCGHGTHVAGIVAGDGTASSGPRCYQTFYGVARGANIVSVRVLNAEGQGAVSDVISGLQWVIANQSALNIRVVNLSLGHPVGESYLTDPLCQAVEAAWQAGIVVVCAAGNAGRLTDSPNLVSLLTDDNEGYGTAYGSIQSPANDPDVITVGALKQTDSGEAIATYSSRGPTRLDFVMKPDIVAPGNQIISLKAPGAYLDTTYGSTNSVPLSSYVHTSSTRPSPSYFIMSGTSMATPVVAGAAALLLQANPALSPDTVKARLMISADKWTDGNEGDPLTYGAGALDIPAALQCTYTATQTAATPLLSRDLLGNVAVGLTDILGPDGSLWGTGLTSPDPIWGSQVIWGEGTLSGSQVIWGESTLSDSQVIWGESVWDDQVIWGEDESDADLSSTTMNGE